MGATTLTYPVQPQTRRPGSISDEEAAETMLRFDRGQRVRTRRDGDGVVVGFYRTETPTVLVELDAGGARQYLPDQLQPVAA